MLYWRYTFKNTTKDGTTIQKRERSVITFYTTADAMAMESLCTARGLGGRMIPVPGEITADCGLAWSAEPRLEEILTDTLKTAKIPVQGVYRLMI